MKDYSDGYTCYKCGLFKPLNEFYRLSSGRPSSRCKICNGKNSTERYRKDPAKTLAYQSIWYREKMKDPEFRKRRASWKRVGRYGLTEVQFEEMLESQENSCLLCGILFDSGSRSSSLVVDHDHATGKMRGLICWSCNIGLGAFKDDIKILEKAIKYLESQKSEI